MVFKKNIVGILRKAVAKGTEQALSGYVRCLVDTLEVASKLHDVPAVLSTHVEETATETGKLHNFFLGNSNFHLSLELLTKS